jgi:hypothetical protein
MSSKQCDACGLEPASTSMSERMVLVNCDDFTCHNDTTSPNALGESGHRTSQLVRLQSTVLGPRPDKYAQLVVPNNVLMCTVMDNPNRMYDMDRALGEPFVQVASKRQPHLIETRVSKLSHQVFARINETARDGQAWYLPQRHPRRQHLVQQTVTT